MAGKIYLVATPIGNLNDMTFRAIDTLKNVDLIAAEDTRQTLKLLNYFEISKPMISYHRHNEDIKSEGLIEKVLAGKNIAIVTDAGTPGISDPGEEIVKEAIKNREKFSPLKLNAPYTLKLKVRENPDSDEISYIEYTSNDLYEVMKKFWSYL